jgi:DNA-binding transcriptional ArsR family regulator
MGGNSGMSVTIELTADDLLQTRFAYNPLIELTVSYHMLVGDHDPGYYRRWIEEARTALQEIELPFMDALIVRCGPGGKKCNCNYVPDFLTPTPSVVQLSLETEIDRLLDTPVELIRNNVAKLIDIAGDSEMRQHYLVYPRESIFCLAQELRLYWKHVLEPHWSRLTAILDSDVLYHARRMALEGPEIMLQELHPSLAFQGNRLVLDKPKSGVAHFYKLTGTGLQLVPTIFGGTGVHWQIEPEWQPMVIYIARGLGLWDQRIRENNTALELALGEGRARVLQELSQPSNTGELAQRLQISAGAVSQHLSRLNQAGLVEPQRNGRRVYYHLTDRGAQLLVLFDKTG